MDDDAALIAALAVVRADRQREIDAGEERLRRLMKRGPRRVDDEEET